MAISQKKEEEIIDMMIVKNMKMATNIRKESTYYLNLDKLLPIKLKDCLSGKI
jgi:hypothetical protein